VQYTKNQQAEYEEQTKQKQHQQLTLKNKATAKHGIAYALVFT